MPEFDLGSGIPAHHAAVKPLEGSLGFVRQIMRFKTTYIRIGCQQSEGNAEVDKNDSWQCVVVECVELAIAVRLQRQD